MNLETVIARLVDQCPALKKCGGATDFSTVNGAASPTPCAYVLPAAEQGGQNPFLGQIVEQTISATFAVVYGCKNLSDAKGTKAVTDLQPIRESGFAALLNWQPFADYDGCEFDSGSLLHFENGILWWQDTFRTQFIRRSV